jgi:hypothetical protein
MSGYFREGDLYELIGRIPSTLTRTRPALPVPKDKASFSQKPSVRSSAPPPLRAAELTPFQKIVEGSGPTNTDQTSKKTIKTTNITSLFRPDVIHPTHPWIFP